jgi:hypothetical protein
MPYGCAGAVYTCAGAKYSCADEKFSGAEAAYGCIPSKSSCKHSTSACTDAKVSCTDATSGCADETFGFTVAEFYAAGAASGLSVLMRSCKVLACDSKNRGFYDGKQANGLKDPARRPEVAIFLETSSGGFFFA